MAKDTSTQIFISYRREGGEALAHLLYDRLTQKKFHVFLDVESLRSGKFNNALYKKIEECDDFLFVLPENSLARCVAPDDWLRLEIEYALKCKKNIIPIMMRNFKFPKFLPPTMEDLRNYNGVAASMSFFDAVMEKLIGMLVSKPEEPFPFKKFFALLAVIILLCVVGAVLYSPTSQTTQSSQGGTTKATPGETNQPPSINRSNSTITASNKTIKGSNNEITGNNNKIVGSNNIITGNNHIVVGSNNEIHGSNNKITGSNNTIRGNNNVVIVGSNNNSYGKNNKSNGANNHEYE